jgi:hypothetical protein
LSLSRNDQICEQLTIIVSPKMLNLSPGELARILVTDEVEYLASLEKQWDGTPEQYDSPNTVGQVITLPEKKAAERKRDLGPGDPAPQIIYRISLKPKADKIVLINASLPVKQ